LSSVATWWTPLREDAMELTTGPTGQSLERDASRRRVDVARTALKTLYDLAAPDGALLAGPVVARQVGIAMIELSAIDDRIALGPSRPPEPRRVACAHCGKLIMAAATLCGFCWQRRADSALLASDEGT